MDARGIRRAGTGVAADRRVRLAATIVLGAAAVAVVIAIIIIAFIDAAAQERTSVASELDADGSARARLVADWRRERLDDASAVSDSRLLRDAVGRLQGWVPTDEHTLADTRVEIANDLELLRSEAAYGGALLVDRDGRLLAASSTSDGELPRASEAAIQAVLHDGRPTFSVPFKASRDGDIHLDLATPILDDQGIVQAVVLLRIDPSATLFSDILGAVDDASKQDEPVHISVMDTTADRVLEIGPAHFDGTGGFSPGTEIVPGSDLAVRILVATADGEPYAGPGEREVPAGAPPPEASGPGAASAPPDATQPTETQVIADIRRIEDSSWVLVTSQLAAQVDDHAIAAGMEALLRVLAVVTFVALVLGAGFAWRQRRLLKRLTTAEEERAIAASRVDDTMTFAHDIVLLLDEDGALLDANEAAVRAYGHDLASLRTMHLADLRAPAERASVPGDLAAAKAPGGIVRQTVHLRKDGSTFPVEVNLHALRGGETLRFESVVRDVRDRMETDRAMQQQLDELRRWQAGAIGREERILELKAEINELLETTGKPARYASVEQAARVGDGR